MIPSYYKLQNMYTFTLSVFCYITFAFVERVIFYRRSGKQGTPADTVRDFSPRIKIFS